MAAKVVGDSSNNGLIDLYWQYGGVMSNNIKEKEVSGPGPVFSYVSGKGSSVGVVKIGSRCPPC